MSSTIASAPLANLVVLTQADLTAQGIPQGTARSLMAHRTRRILTGQPGRKGGKGTPGAVHAGEFGAQDLKAMVAAGIIPQGDYPAAAKSNGTAKAIAAAKAKGRTFAPCNADKGSGGVAFTLPSFS